jgi:hypothetical protein
MLAADDTARLGLLHEAAETSEQLHAADSMDAVAILRGLSRAVADDQRFSGPVEQTSSAEPLLGVGADTGHDTRESVTPDFPDSAGKVTSSRSWQVQPLSSQRTLKTAGPSTLQRLRTLSAPPVNCPIVHSTRLAPTCCVCMLPPDLTAPDDVAEHGWASQQHPLQAEHQREADPGQRAPRGSRGGGWRPADHHVDARAGQEVW